MDPNSAARVSLKETWGQRIENLKSAEREARRQRRFSESTQLQEELEASKLLAPELVRAIQQYKDVMVPDFVSVIEKIAMEVPLSEIVEQVSRAGNTMLHIAAKCGSEEILELIAEHFPQMITRRNMEGDTVLHVAARTHNSVLVSIVLNCYAAHFANNFCRDNIGEEEEEEGVLWRIRNEHGNTALHEAVMTSNVEVVKLLFTADGVVAHYLNKEGKSPLYLAVETGNNEIVSILVEAPFHNRERHQGTSPLHAAILARTTGQRTKHNVSQPLVEGWLRHRESSDTPERLGSPTRSINPSDMLKKLVGTRTDLIYLKDQKGGTPLHCAASIGHLKAVRTLVNASPLSAFEWDKKGHLPVHVASKKGHVNVVKEIVQQQFDPMDLLNERGQNILHIAAKNGKDLVVNYILREEKLENLLNQKDKNGNTPLHLASKYLHPKVLLLLTKEKRLNINLVNNEGLTARDLVLLRRKSPPTFRELLSFAILKFVGVPLSEKGKRIRRSQTEPPKIEWIKGRISTILVVAILVATVTFSAGFSMPGGLHSSDDTDTKKRGMATLLNRKMFYLFTICDVIAMYSSTMGSFILLWAQLGDFHVAVSATYFALYLVGLALVTMSVAFMAAVHLVVSNLSWLADIVVIIGIIFLLMFLGVYILLIYPLGARPIFLRHVSDFIFRMIIPLSGSHGKSIGKVKVNKTKVLEEPEKDKLKDHHEHLRRTKMLAKQRTI